MCQVQPASGVLPICGPAAVSLSNPLGGKKRLLAFVNNKGYLFDQSLGNRSDSVCNGSTICKKAKRAIDNFKLAAV